MKKLESITAFFPAYNDAGTIPTMVIRALRTLQKVTDDYEVVVVNDGSGDYTQDMLEELARIYPQVRIVRHRVNQGYGAALRSGFAAAGKAWVFYTDGDAQYDPSELVSLVRAVGPRLRIDHAVQDERKGREAATEERDERNRAAEAHAKRCAAPRFFVGAIGRFESRPARDVVP